MVKEYRYYTYKVTFRDLPGYFYYGRKKDNGKPYFGSPKTFKHLWDFFEPEIQILQWYKTSKEVEEAESALIGHTWKQEWGGKRYSLNRNKGGRVDEGVCRENGKKNLEKMLQHPNTVENRRENGKRMNQHPNTVESRKNTVEKMNQHPNTVENRKVVVEKMLQHPNTVENRKKNWEKLRKEKSKPVMCIETSIVYPSAAEAGRRTNIRQGNIRRSAGSEGRIAAGGYHWVHTGEIK